MSDDAPATESTAGAPSSVTDLEVTAVRLSPAMIHESAIVAPVVAPIDRLVNRCCLADAVSVTC